MRMQPDHLIGIGHSAIGYLHQVQQDMCHRLAGEGKATPVTAEPIRGLWEVT
jgi:hypothetical protein